MAANVRAKPAGFGTLDVVTATEFNALDVNGAQSVNRNSTQSGTRRIPLAPVETFHESGGPTYTTLCFPTYGTLVCTNTAVADLFIPIEELPHGHTLTTVTMAVDPVAGHGGQPAVLPSISVYSVNLAGVAALLGSGTHAWADVATYEAGFNLTASALAHTIDRSNTYWVKVILESGGNSVTGCALLALSATVTIDHAYGGTDLSQWV